MTASGGEEHSLSQIRENLKDITECSICKETFTDPRTLPCIHTFCRKCLEAAASKSGKSPGSKLPCPMCRHEFVVPAKGVEGLQKNFFMVKLIDMTKHMAASSSSSLPSSSVRPSCDVCPPANEGNSESVPSAEKFCRNCRLRLCSSCVRHHGRSRLTETHDLVPVSAENMAEILLVRPDECEKHERERLKLHCTDCQTVVCAFCFIEEHPGHRWSEVGKAADEFRRRIETNVENLAKQSSDLRSKQRELEILKTDTNRKLSDLEKRIQDRKTLMQHVIEKHANSLVVELGTRRQEKLKEIKLEEETIDMQLANQRSYVDYCCEMTAKGSAVDVCRAVKDLNTRADDLQRMCQSVCQRKVEPIALKCNMPTVVDEFMKNKDKNFVGEIAKGYDSV